MNRLKNITKAVYSKLEGSVSKPVRTGTRDAQGDLWQPPFVRIERPTTNNAFQNTINKRINASLLINIFSDESGLSEIYNLEQEVRNALDGAELDLGEDMKAILKPREEMSSPSTNEKNGREIKQQSVEFKLKIHEQ